MHSDILWFCCVINNSIVSIMKTQVGTLTERKTHEYISFILQVVNSQPSTVLNK